MSAIDQYIKRAEEYFFDSILLFENKRYNSSASRSYYCAFNAVQALLTTQNFTPATHQGVLILFSKHFIHTKIFPRYFSKYLTECLNKRMIGDYDIGHGVNEEECKIAMEYSKEIFETVKNYLIQNGFMN